MSNAERNDNGALKFCSMCRGCGSVYPGNTCSCVCTASIRRDRAINKLGEAFDKIKLKPSMRYIPPIAILKMGEAMCDGVSKYEPFDWRDEPLSLAEFYDKLMRHILDWYNGDDCASDSGIHHLAHLMADCAMVLDAIDLDNVQDDRPIRGDK